MSGSCRGIELQVRVKLSMEGRWIMAQKMIMIPEERYYKMLEPYDKTMKEIARLKKALEEAATSTKAK